MSSPCGHTDHFVSLWTGKPPAYGICPGVNAHGTLKSLPQISLNATRKELFDYFNNTWTFIVVLFDGLASEQGFYHSHYHKLRHPMIFYYLHRAVFYINKLRVAGIFEQPVKLEFEQLFETGVDEIRWDDLYENNVRI
ncbi:unnamed protein product [Rotaria socialis]|uniref:Uncharacterized protein n=1 Tax=Rotaria socialis TaxID=392032 RepID=A0A817YSH5_9BILA|nr:unnamed protein product [Rotaria socialis]